MMVKPQTVLVNYKVIQSGDVVEFMHYSKGYLKGFEITSESSGVHRQDKDKDNDVYESPESIYIRSSRRAAKKLVRVINSNVNQYGRNNRAKFLTFTFAEHITDLKEANKLFNKFIRRFNYSVFDSNKRIAKYTVVWELTDIGRIHFHAVFYNIPYVPFKQLSKLWSYGFVYITAIDDVDNVGLYVSKYMSKPDERYLDEKYSNAKRYFSSQGLKKPLEITNQKSAFEAIAHIVSAGFPEKYSYEYDSDEMGLITYKSYIIPQLNLKRDVLGY